jgi:hypothetical protein
MPIQPCSVIPYLSRLAWNVHRVNYSLGLIKVMVKVKFMCAGHEVVQKRKGVGQPNINLGS